jgi:hypothetical protein
MQGPLSDKKSGLYFLFLLGIVNAAFLRSESHRTHVHSLLSLFCDSSNLEGQFPVFTSARNRVAQLYPRALGFACEVIPYGGDILHFLYLLLLSIPKI